MRVLLDESLPVRLRNAFSSSHEVFTVRYMGWLGKKNEELLAAMDAEGFEVFVTPDKNLRYQQSLERYSISVVVSDAPDNTIDTLRMFIPKLEALLAEGGTEKVIVVN